MIWDESHYFTNLTLHCEKISPCAPYILEQSLWIWIFGCICVHDVCRHHQINLYSFAVEMRCIPSTKVHILCTLDYIRCRKVHYNSYKICAIVYMMLLVSYMEYGVLSLSLTGFILPAIWNCLHIFDVHYMDFGVSPRSLDLAPEVCSFLHTL